MNTVVSLEELSIYEALMNVMRATGSCMPAGGNHTASEGVIGAEVHNPACQSSQQAFHLSRQASHQPFPLSKRACPPSEQALNEQRMLAWILLLDPPAQLYDALQHLCMNGYGILHLEGLPSAPDAITTPEAC